MSLEERAAFLAQDIDNQQQRLTDACISGAPWAPIIRELLAALENAKADNLVATIALREFVMALMVDVVPAVSDAAIVGKTFSVTDVFSAVRSLIQQLAQAREEAA